MIRQIFHKSMLLLGLSASETMPGIQFPDVLGRLPPKRGSTMRRKADGKEYTITGRSDHMVTLQGAQAGDTIWRNRSETFEEFE